MEKECKALFLVIKKPFTGAEIGILGQFLSMIKARIMSVIIRFDTQHPK